MHLDGIPGEVPDKLIVQMVTGEGTRGSTRLIYIGDARRLVDKFCTASCHVEYR
jgi:hypothetical protein